MTVTSPPDILPHRQVVPEHPLGDVPDERLRIGVNVADHIAYKRKQKVRDVIFDPGHGGG